MPNHHSLLAAAEGVAGLLADRGIDAVVIGAAALAAHRYVRHTEDIDLGVNVAVRELDAVAAGLREAGYEVEVREPDGQDPLGGVRDSHAPAQAGRWFTTVELRARQRGRRIRWPPAPAAGNALRTLLGSPVNCDLLVLGLTSRR